MSPPQNTGDGRYMVPGLVRGLALLEAFGDERASLSLAKLLPVLDVFDDEKTAVASFASAKDRDR